MIYLQDPDLTIYQGDVLDTLRELEAGSVDCVITSPPYWGLRDYGTGEWEGGDAGCDHIAGRGGHLKESKASTRGGANKVAEAPTVPMLDVCSKCGATRIDKQIGLESTPDEYVTRMVDVFREVRRVLADHGTLWLNLGDSYNAYNGNAKSGGPVSLTQSAQRPRLPSGHGLTAKALKPKNLVGIPWRVAFALQQPYYAGRIKDEGDRRWLAAIVDSEGCIHIHRRKAGTASGSKFTRKDGTEVNYARKQDTYGVMVSIDNTSKALVDRCEDIIGQGSRYVHEKATGKQQRKQTLYRLTLTGQQSRELLRELYPFLVAKQQEARIAYHSPSSGDEAAACHEAIKALHNGSETGVDYKAPPTLYEPGWYVRSDICWAKSNPMPESVTDRPTKSHEYVFLLSKRPRYFFDQEAVREKYAPATIERDAYGYNHAFANQFKGSPTDKRHTDGKVLPPGSFARGPDRNRRTVEPGAGTHENHQTGERDRWPNGGRNVRSVWDIATQPYSEAHFATFPEELVRRCLLAGCPEWVCRVCEKPRERITDVSYTKSPAHGKGSIVGSRGVTERDDSHLTAGMSNKESLGGMPRVAKVVDTLGFTDCGHNDYRPGVALDIFGGSGTTALVARKHARRAVLIELNPDYCEMAARRLSQQSLFAEAT